MPQELPQESLQDLPQNLPQAARLVKPSVAYRESFLASHAEWEGAWQDGAGVDADADFSAPGAFEQWVARLLSQESEPLSPGMVTCTFRWLVEGDQYLGSVALRHELNEYLANFGGHLGYGIRPSARRQGHATAALAQMLDLARERGMDRVLLTCAEANLGSRGTIEANGGVLEDVRVDGDGVALRRYWISLGA